MLILVALAVSGMTIASLAPRAAAQSPVNVGIQSYAFSPGTIRVVIGVNNTVTWTNHDPVAHTVTADGSSFNDTLSAGATYTHTFTAVGTFAYHCTIHTYMKGTVVVVAGPSSGSTSTGQGYGSSGGIPEFPFQAVTAAALTVLVAVSYLAIRRNQRS